MIIYFIVAFIKIVIKIYIKYKDAKNCNVSMFAAFFGNTMKMKKCNETEIYLMCIKRI